MPHDHANYLHNLSICVRYNNIYDELRELIDMLLST